MVLSLLLQRKVRREEVNVDIDASIAASMYAHKMKVLNAKQYGQVMWQAYVKMVWIQILMVRVSLRLELRRTRKTCVEWH